MLVSRTSRLVSRIGPERDPRCKAEVLEQRNEAG